MPKAQCLIQRILSICKRYIVQKNLCKIRSSRLWKGHPSVCISRWPERREWKADDLLREITQLFQWRQRGSCWNWTCDWLPVSSPPLENQSFESWFRLLPGDNFPCGKNNSSGCHRYYSYCLYLLNLLFFPKYDKLVVLVLDVYSYKHRYPSLVLNVSKQWQLLYALLYAEVSASTK